MQTCVLEACLQFVKTKECLAFGDKMLYICPNLGLLRSYTNTKIMNHSHKGSRSAGHFSTVITCISTTLVLVLLGLVVMFVTMANNFSQQLREQLTIEVMLNDSITAGDQLATQRALQQAPYSRKVDYISKEQGIKEMNDVMGGDIGTFEGTSPVPAEFEVYLKYDYANLDSLRHFEKSIISLPGVTEINYPGDVMESLDRTIPAVGIGLLVVAALLALVSFSLINNTIRMSIYARRYSIHIMKLVGASWAFIRRPFIWQAMRIGLVAALIAGALLGGALYYLQCVAGMGDIYINNLVTPEVWVITMGCILVCGLLLTAWCAYVSVNHHLRMKGESFYVR